MLNATATADYLAAEVRKMGDGLFEVVSEGEGKALPLVAFRITKDKPYDGASSPSSSPSLSSSSSSSSSTPLAPSSAHAASWRSRLACLALRRVRHRRSHEAKGVGASGLHPHAKLLCACRISPLLVLAALAVHAVSSLTSSPRFAARRR